MKIVSLSTKQFYDIELYKSGENAMPCPECSKTRKKPRAKSFSFNAEKKTGYCQNCCVSFVEYSTVFLKKEYEKPIWKNKTDLTDGAVKWFEKRGITQQVLKKMKIYSDIEFMPQTQKDEGVICFPYFFDETLINIKFRDKQKNFKLSKNSELIFYNLNCLKENDSVIITEGEIDCLSFIQSGIENVVSVPNGAQAANLEYLDNYIDLFDKLQTIYLSVDNDLKGYELRNELLRRFGQERCKIIELDGCKDANEFLTKFGSQELKLKYENARYIPVDGVIDVEDQYDDCYNLYVNGMQPGKTIGMSDIDDLITWEQGRLAVVTGIPGHGKSEFVDFIAIKLCINHGWKIGYFSPENYPFKYHFSKLARKLIGKSFDAKYMNSKEFDGAYNYILQNIHFVYPEDDTTIENILNKAKYLVKRFGIRQFIIDPFNKIEHLRNKNETETEYVSRFLDMVITFAKKYQILFWLVAHPVKMKRQKDEMKFEIPTLYDISGSANFYNKPDYGLAVYRNFTDNLTEIHIPKVKFDHLGKGGMVNLKYNGINGRYESALFDNFNNSPIIDFEGRYVNMDKIIEPQPNLDFDNANNNKPELDDNGVDINGLIPDKDGNYF